MTLLALLFVLHAEHGGQRRLHRLQGSILNTKGRERHVVLRACVSRRDRATFAPFAGVRKGASVL